MLLPTFQTFHTFDPSELLCTGGFLCCLFLLHLLLLVFGVELDLRFDDVLEDSLSFILPSCFFQGECTSSHSNNDNTHSVNLVTLVGANVLTSETFGGGVLFVCFVVVTLPTVS